MGTENHNNADQSRQNKASQNQGDQNTNQTQDGERNFDRQQNQQGVNKSGGLAGQTDPNRADLNRDRQSGNPDDENGLDGGNNAGNNAGQQH